MSATPTFPAWAGSTLPQAVKGGSASRSAQADVVRCISNQAPGVSSA